AYDPVYHGAYAPEVAAIRVEQGEEMTVMATEKRDRWERLVDTLAEAGISARVDRGRERSDICLRADDSHLVIVHDTWWRKNPDVWTGWEVYVEGSDSITTRTYPRTKKRGEVRRNVEDAFAFVQNAR